MSEQEEEKNDISPSFEEQVKFLRKARQQGSTRFQKTTEFNVSKKLKRELDRSEHDQGALDARLEAAINREAGNAIFDDSLAAVLRGKKTLNQRTTHRSEGAEISRPAADTPAEPPAAQEPYQPDLPEHELPEPDLPGHELPEPDLPGHELPEPDLPGHELPEPDLPGHQLPDPDLPDHQLPDHQLPDHQLPDHQLPDHQLPDPDVPDHESYQHEPDAERPELPDAGQPEQPEQPGSIAEALPDPESFRSGYESPSYQSEAQLDHLEESVQNPEDYETQNSDQSGQLLEPEHEKKDHSASLERETPASQRAPAEYKVSFKRPPALFAPKKAAASPESNRQQAPAAPTQAESDLKECPRCAELIKKKAVYCRFCHLDLPAYKASDIEHQVLESFAAESSGSDDESASVAESSGSDESAEAEAAEEPKQDETVQQAIAGELKQVEAVQEAIAERALEDEAQEAPTQEPITEERTRGLVIAEELRQELIRLSEFLERMPEFAAEFKRETGLELISADQKISVCLNANGDNVNLYTVDASESGLEEARSYAGYLIEQYADLLSMEFGIEFPRDGEAACRQLEYDDEYRLRAGALLKACKPRIDQLKALHRAIEYSWPSSYQQAGQLPMLVVFISETLVKDEDMGVRLKYFEDGKPVLFIASSLCNQGQATEFDPIGNDNFESWQASIMRELAWKSAVDSSKFPLSNNELESIGWVYVGDGFYAFKTRSGELYLPYGGAETAEQAWARCNENGDPVGKDGQLISQQDDLVFMSSAELARKALRRPPSDHFDTLEEEIADALRCFRQGPQWRLHLGKVNPELYQLVKTIDQICINRCYLPLSNSSAMIRSPKGALVENSAENQMELAKFEQKISGVSQK